LNKNLNKILIFFIALSLLFGGYAEALFLPLPAQAARTILPVKETGPKLKVVTAAKPEAGIAVEPVVVLGNFSSCDTASGIKSNYVQDSARIDLNQPADCFDLEIGQIAFQPPLEVKSLGRVVPEVKLAALPTTVKAYAFLPASPSSHQVSFIFFPQAGQERQESFAGTVIIAKDKTTAKTDFHYNLSLIRLNVLRC